MNNTEIDAANPDIPSNSCNIKLWFYGDYETIKNEFKDVPDFVFIREEH